MYVNIALLLKKIQVTNGADDNLTTMDSIMKHILGFSVSILLFFFTQLYGGVI